MRILIFSAQYLPTPGGVERYTANLAATLAARGHRVKVVTSALPGQPAGEAAGGVEVLRLPAALWMKGRFPVPRFGRAFRAAAAELFGEKWDFALINTRFYVLSLWAARRCKQAGVPAIVVEHGTSHLPMGPNPLLAAAGHLYEHMAMAFMRRSCGVFYGVSRASCAWMKHFKVECRGVLYNAVDPAALGQAQEGAAALAGTSPVVLFAGRMIREKGVWELLEAFRLVREAHPEARLVMAGEGPLLEALRQSKAPGVELPGAVSHGQLLGLLAACAVFCLPSYSEGFSTVVLEAAALGACVVTTAVGGSPELIFDGESGILLKDLRPETIAGALLRALEDEPWRRQAGRLAAQTVAEGFTWEKTADALLEAAAARKKG